MEPSTCSERTCEYSATSQHSSWISRQVFPGCKCCVLDSKLVPDGYSWESEGEEYGKIITNHSKRRYFILECCEGKIVSVYEGSGSEISKLEGILAFLA